MAQHRRYLVSIAPDGGTRVQVQKKRGKSKWLTYAQTWGAAGEGITPLDIAGMHADAGEGHLRSFALEQVEGGLG